MKYHSPHAAVVTPRKIATLAMSQSSSTDPEFVARPIPHKRSRRSNRDSIEAELFNLRYRQNGFVKSESLRLTSPRSIDDDTDGQLRGRGRRWHRRHTGERSIIEKLRDAARKSRVLELRLAGRRSWWPKFDGKVTPYTPTYCPSPLNGVRVWGTKSQCTNGNKSKGQTLLVDFPRRERKQSRSSSNLDRAQNGSSARSTQAPRTRPRKSIARFWKKSNGKPIEEHPNEKDVDTTCEKRDNEASNRQNTTNRGLKSFRDQAPPGIHTENLFDIAMDIDDENEPVDKKGRKKRLHVIAATVASISVSSLGIAAVILL